MRNPVQHRPIQKQKGEEICILVHFLISIINLSTISKGRLSCGMNIYAPKYVIQSIQYSVCVLIKKNK